ncbi:WD40 repeat-like protein [Paxillus ammoniavirescens]|nr:WD40 repeat-like protein [Paxillus ammoniavirescens]
MSNTSPKSTDLTAKPLMTMSGHGDTVIVIIYLPGGKRVVSCSRDSAVVIWDLEKGEKEGTKMGHEGWFYDLAVTKDGNIMLGGGEGNRIRVWDVGTRELIEEWASPSSSRAKEILCCIALSPDDRLAASGQSDGRIVIREMKRRGAIKHSIKTGSSVDSLCFSPNVEKLACSVSGGDHSAIRVYDVESGNLVLDLEAHENSVDCIRWSLDGSQLFSASVDQTIRCWDSETGKSIGEPWTGHTKAVVFLSLSPDGKKLASASDDHTVRFWDTRSGNPIGCPLQHESDLCAVAFSPSGDFVASGGYDHKVSIWRVPWSDETQTQIHHDHPLLDLPVVPIAKDHHRGKLDSLDLPATCPPIISSPRLPAQVADPTTTPIMTRVQRFQETAWNLNDIHCNFAHNLTGYVVQESKDPFTCGSFGDIYRGKLCMNGISIDVAIRTYESTNDDNDDNAQKNEVNILEFLYGLC